MTELIAYIVNNCPKILDKTIEQLYLVTLSIATAIVIGLPLAVLIVRRARLRQSIFAVINILQTIPGLALLAFFIPVLGIGTKPALVALTLYAMLPIVRNTYTGLSQISGKFQEAAAGLGLTKWQRLRHVELPLALPTIIAGLRTATVANVGITTLAAFIGAGGLGDFINQGLAMNDNRLILCGAVPAAVLALTLDFGLARMEQWFTPTRRRSGVWFRHVPKFVAGSLILMLGIGIWASMPFQQKAIVIGSKKFSEQYLLADMMALMIEAKTDLKVERKLNLGTTSMIHQALLDGHIDVYPEYTGTAYQVIMHETKPRPPQQLYRHVRHYYQAHYKLTWLEPFGFENRQALAVNPELSDRYQLHTISDLAQINRHLAIAAPAGFLKRSDAYEALVKGYPLKFSEIRQMEPGLAYSAIAQGKVDVIMAFSTDGRLQKYRLQLLKDDQQVFPHYQAAPIVRMATLRQHPEIKKALQPLAGLLTNRVIRQLNYQVDVEKKPPMIVAKRFLERHDFL